MNDTAKAGSLWVLAVATGLAISAPSCGDGDPTDVGSGGSSATGNRGGTSPNGGRGGSPGGSDSGGSSGQGGTTGGSAGSAGQGGSSGSAGSAGTGGMGGEGGEGGQGGEGGEGGEPSVVLYDFETGVQGWSTSTSGASVAQSTDQHVDGSNSLKITHGVIDANSTTGGPSNVIVQVSGAPVWPGTVITFNAFLPAGFDTTGGTYFQAFTQANNYLINFETAGNSSRTAVPGGWTTWTYTVPNTFPGGLQILGFQLGDNAGGTTIAAGDVYIDSITATGGVANCALATPTGLHDFETSPLDAMYQVDANNPAPRPTLSQATDRALTGSGSMKVSFAGLPAPTGSEPTKRIVYIDKPIVYCGQTITVNVFLPTGSDGMTFQVFAQYNNYGVFTGTGARTVTRDQWNAASYTIPTTVGPGGIQRVGLEFMYSGTAAFTGDVWVDAISW